MCAPRVSFVLEAIERLRETDRERGFELLVCQDAPASILPETAPSIGTDAQPYFRIFNPMTQGERFDPDAEYVKRTFRNFAASTPRRSTRGPRRRPRSGGVPPRRSRFVVNHDERREAAIATFERARGRD